MALVAADLEDLKRVGDTGDPAAGFDIRHTYTRASVTGMLVHRLAALDLAWKFRDQAFARKLRNVWFRKVHQQMNELIVKSKRKTFSLSIKVSQL